MASGGIEVSTSVYFRDEFGRFATACDRAVSKAMDEIGQQGSMHARGIVPQIAETIHPVKLAATEVAWYSDHQWAMALEKGVPKHTIAPRNKRVLANEELGFGPAGGPVSHPGVKGRHYLRLSYERMRGKALAIIRRHMP